MWNSTSRPQLQAEAGARRGARAPRCSTRRVSIAHRRAVLEPGLRAASSRSPAPTAGRESSPGRAAARRLLAKPKPGSASATPGSNTRYAVRSEVSFSRIVLTMPTPLAQRAGDARAATSVLPRSTPCRSHQPMRTSSMPSASIAQRDVASQRPRAPRRRRRSAPRTTSSAGLGRAVRAVGVAGAGGASQAAPARLAAAAPRPVRAPSGRPARCSRSCRGRSARPPRRRRAPSAAGRRRAPSRSPSAACGGSP